MPPERIFDQALIAPITALENNRVIVDPKQIEIILADHMHDRRFHPGHHLGVAEIKRTITAGGPTIARHQPIGVLLPQARRRADRFDLKPQAEAHALRMRVRNDRLQPVR